MSEVSAISNKAHQIHTQGSMPHSYTPDTSPKSSPLVKTGGRRELPPHWERVKSEQHGRYYYWNKETGSTTWKFPEEEVKEFQKMVRSHNYMNVKPTPRKRSSTHSGSSHSSPSPSDSPTKSPSNKTIDGTQNGLDSSQGQRSPDLVTRKQSEYRGQSSTDPQSVSPLPKSRTSSRSSYVNIEVATTVSPLQEPQTPISPFPTERPSFSQELSLEQTTPTSPVPQGQTTPLSPTPPLPSRNYSESDLSLSPPPQERGSESETSSIDGVRTVQHTVSSQGHEYAVIDRGFRSQQSEQGDPPSPDVTSAPPVPLRAQQRLAQDAQEDGYTEVAERAQRSRGGYIELDMQHNTDPQLVSQPPRPAAYAIVELDKDREKSEPSRRSSLPVKKVLVPPKPRPYEIPTASMENLVEVGYEEIKDDKGEPAEDGYMEVKKDTLLSYQRTSSQGQLKTRRHSQKEPYTIPSPTGGESPLPRRESPLTGMDSPLSQDSVFDSLPRYDLPSNSNRLQKMNATLPRGNEQLMPGYSRLADLSKEAILLRSGVTLRRYGQLDSMSSFMSRGDDGSESSAGSDQDDGLEPVHKAIKSLETSLGVSADNLSEPPIQLVRAPSGPPSWYKAQKRRHAYERINDSPENGLEMTNQDAGKRHMISASLEMDWDATEFSEAKTGLGRVKELSKHKSSSQPNLLRDSDVEFPHLKRPPRVSEEAFRLRKMRLINHEYEDVEKGEIPSDMGHVGDVNVLTSAIKESWLEGDKGQSGEEGLPKGWQSMKDEYEKTYYWHVPTGRTQYERPSPQDVKRLSLSVDDRHSVRGSQSDDTETRKRPSPTFKTTYLGSQDIAESELVQGQCVTVVHSCINKMSAQPHTPGAKENVVFLQVQNANLRWLDPETSTPTLTQAINKIRVWGIGLDNDRDFGYVARDLNTKKHKCHVFRCERPARAVARSLLEAHQKERGERKVKKAAQKKEGSITSSSEQSGESVQDPQQPPSAERRTVSHSLSPGQSDYSERVTCSYLGSCDVFQQQGIEVVNEAVGRLCAENGGKCLSVNIDVTPSSIRIASAQDDTLIGEHRVRFLCFLGIAKEDRYCGYVLDNGMKGTVKQLRFHGFCKEPNTDGLCLAIHKACQARYQRVLESNPDAVRESERQAITPVKERSPPSKSRSTPNLFERLGNLRKSKNSKPLVEDDSKLQSFVVQYLGCQGVSKAEGLDAVRVPLQQMAQPKSPSHAVPPFLVDLDVTPGGICLTDPHKKVFSRKTFSAKNITYAVRVRNYFAFITRDGGKLNCHVFLENEVDAGTIVSTIEKMLAPENSKSPTK